MKFEWLESQNFVAEEDELIIETTDHLFTSYCRSMSKKAGNLIWTYGNESGT